MRTTVTARRALGVIAVVVCTLGAPRGARAYVPYRTASGVAFHWPQPCVPIRVYVDDLPELPPARIMAAATAAAAAWSAAANACSSMNFVVERGSGPGPAAQYDSLSTITFRRTSWCHNSGTTCAPYDASAPSITSVFATKTTGEIRDTDIELNARDFQWTDVGAAGASPTTEDLQNVLTHELGHALGFDHTCWEGAAPETPPLDDAGNPAPTCSTASEAVRATTMFAAVLPGEVSKRTLEADDQRAVCEAYPRPATGDAGAPSFASCEALNLRRDGGADAGPGSGLDAATRADGAGPSKPALGGGGCAVGGSGTSGCAVGFLALLLHRRRRRNP